MDKNIDKDFNIFEYFAPDADINITNFPGLTNSNSKKVWGVGLKTDEAFIPTGPTRSMNGYKSWTPPGSSLDKLVKFTKYQGYYIANKPGASYVLYNETSTLPYKKDIIYQYQIAMFRGNGVPGSDTSANTAPVVIDASLPFILNNKVKTIFGISATGRAWRSWNGGTGLKPNSLQQLIPGESYIFVSIPTNNTVNWTLYDFPTPTATATPTPTPTPTPTISPTPGPTATATATPGPTATATATPGPTATATPGPTATPTATPVSFDGILACGGSGSAAGEQCISCSGGGCSIQLGVENTITSNFPNIGLMAGDGTGHGTIYGNDGSSTSGINLISVPWNASSPSDLNTAKVQAVVRVKYYGNDTENNFGLIDTKILQSTAPGFDWGGAPYACAAGGTGVLCTEVSSSILLSLFSITSTPVNIYYFLLEIDAVDCAGTYAISSRRIADDIGNCSGGTVDYNSDGTQDACRDCVCTPGVYDTGCPSNITDGLHPAGRRPCGMIAVHT